MGRGADAAGAAAEVEPAGHHRQPQFVHDPAWRLPARASVGC
jgi:hypothetical protein